MTWQTILYFTIILLTGASTGLLAIHAWRQPPAPYMRAYAGLALSECLLAVVEIFSMLSGTQAQALFWFKLRFLFIAVIPVIWLAFALTYNRQQVWPSKKILAAALVIPLIAQILLWSNDSHGLWLKHEVEFHQSGLFWIVEIGARVPAPGFMLFSTIQKRPL